MLVRAAEDRDFQAIAEIVNHYIVSTAIHFAYEPDSVEALRGSWAKHRARYPTLVAEENGTIAGFAKAGTFRERDAYGWICECGVYLRPETIGRGAGASLYTRLLEILRVQGYHVAMAGIALPNDASVRMHERLGFVKVGHVARAGWKFDRWHDLGLWQKDLAAPGSRAEPIRPPDYG